MAQSVGEQISYFGASINDHIINNKIPYNILPVMYNRMIL